eukprot:2250023-Amphidinium_carterae.1
MACLRSWRLHNLRFCGVDVRFLDGPFVGVWCRAKEAKRVRMKHVAILMDVLCGTDRDKDGSISEEDAEAASQEQCKSLWNHQNDCRWRL